MKVIMVIVAMALLGCGRASYDCSMRSDEFEEQKLWECRTSSENPNNCYRYYLSTYCKFEVR